MTPRELDALVAEKVFGLVVYKDEKGHHWFDKPGITRHVSPPKPVVHKVAVERYSTEISAAWLVVEEMRKRGYRFKLIETDPGDQYGVSWWIPREAFGVVEYAQTAPEAICIAALKALGVEIP